LVGDVILLALYHPKRILAMKKNIRTQPKNNKRISRRVINVQSIKGCIIDAIRNGEEFRAKLVNVSSTGAQIYSSKPLNTNMKITLEFDSPDGNHRVVFAGKIVWSRKNPMKSMGRYAYGVNFEEMTPELIKFLEANYSLSPSSEN
jgi:hypothetical protein